MKLAIVLVAILAYSSALPTNQGFDWTKIQSNHAYVQPLENSGNSVGPRIVGGTEAEANSKPYQAAIVIDGTIFCGGSIISSSFVLTAAHCVEGHAYFQIILGAHNIRQGESTQILVTSTSSIVHPNYNRVNLNNDVALIRFPTPVVFNNNIRAITLASVESGSFVDFRGVLSGWGLLSDDTTQIAETLHKVEVSIMANFWCSRTFGTNVVIDSTVCTSGVGNVGGCAGDSGGPLVVEDVLVGVASFVANTGCEQGLPTGYARVTSFRDWIVQNANLQ